jgi:hypothetical protein
MKLTTFFYEFPFHIILTTCIILFNLEEVTHHFVLLICDIQLKYGSRFKSVFCFICPGDTLSYTKQARNKVKA